MAFIIQNQIEIGLFINGYEYPLDALNVLNRLVIGTVARNKFPTFELSVTDVSGTMDKLGLQDGVPIRISVKALQGSTISYEFRKFNVHKQNNGYANAYTIDGYYDSPLWFSGTRSTSMQGTSNRVLGQLAAEAGLKYSGTTTSDSQLWVPENAKYSTFAKRIADQGYVNDQSCMCLGLDLDGTLKYRDINNLKGKPIDVIAYQYKEGYYCAIDLADSSTGFSNPQTGYWNTRVQQSLTAPKVHNQLNFISNSRTPNLNMDVRRNVKAGGVRFSPIDVGNVHPNRERALYQNFRYRNLFSAGVTMLMNMPTTITLFDQVNLSVEKSDTSQDVSVSGTYIVSGRALCVTGTTYGEKIQLIRHGTNEPNPRT